jgi:predicted DNA-binding transcriptional regulator AlpA
MAEFVRFNQLRTAGIPWSRPTILAMVKAGKFPPPKPYGLRSRAWLLADIEAWRAAQSAR